MTLGTRFKHAGSAAWLLVGLPFALLGAPSGCGGAGGAAHANDAEQGKVVGETVPDLKVEGLAGGKPVSLHDLRGKVVLLDVWASWCAPCKEELPMLDDMSGRLGGKGIQIVGISIDESRDDAENFLKSRPNWSITLGHDAEGKNLGILQPPKMPSSFIIDREGVIRAVNAGFTRGDAEKMEARLNELAESPGGKEETASGSSEAPDKPAEPEAKAPPASAPSRAGGLTGSGDLDGAPFEPKMARVVARKNGRVVLTVSDRTDCSSSDAKPGEGTLTLMVPWKDGYEADLATLKRAAVFTRVKGANKSAALKRFKPTGTIRIVSAPVARNAVGKMSIQLAQDHYTLSGDADVLVCVPLK